MRRRKASCHPGRWRKETSRRRKEIGAMTATAAPWQLDRLSASARDAAETAAHEAGLSLSSWLTRLIGETAAAEGIRPPEESPKILEFTREIRDRAPAATLAQRSASAAAPIPLPLPPAPPPS